MFLMNRFFDGAFLTFGIDVLRFLESDQEDRVDPMIYVFPRMTKCTFYKYGVSGEVERHDAVCILPLNVVNEKIYVFLWFWFLFLGVLSFITVLYRVTAPLRSSHSSSFYSYYFFFLHISVFLTYVRMYHTYIRLVFHNISIILSFYFLPGRLHCRS